MWESLPKIIRAFSDAGVSGWMLWTWAMVMTAGFFWGGKNLKAMKHNVAEHLKHLAE